VQDISLDLDKENELVFKLSVEGTKPAKVKNRLLIEADGFSLGFDATSMSDGEIAVVIPPLENMISEGIYSGTLEVIIDDKVFTPIEIQADFKKSISVVAEVVTRRRKETTVSVSPVISVNKREAVERRPAPTSRPKTANRILESEVETSRKSRRRDPDRILEMKLKRMAEKKNINISDKQLAELVDEIKRTKK